jgi:hypothetical protein
MEESQALIKLHIVSDEYIRTLLLKKMGNANDLQGICICQGHFYTKVSSNIGFTWYNRCVQKWDWDHHIRMPSSIWQR